MSGCFFSSPVLYWEKPSPAVQCSALRGLTQEEMLARKQWGTRAPQEMCCKAQRCWGRVAPAERSAVIPGWWDWTDHKDEGSLGRDGRLSIPRETAFPKRCKEYLDCAEMKGSAFLGTTSLQAPPGSKEVKMQRKLGKKGEELMGES